MSQPPAAKINCSKCSKEIDPAQGYIDISQDPKSSNPIHTACFKCEVCSKELSTDSYISDQDRLFHQDCYFKDFLSPCHACGKVFDANYIEIQVEGGTQKYHQACFKCAFCSKGIEEEYYLREGKNSCEDCWKLASPECFICKERVTGKQMVAGGQTMIFHEECMKCCVCQKAIGENTEFTVTSDNKIKHKGCQEGGRQGYVSARQKVLIMSTGVANI